MLESQALPRRESPGIFTAPSAWDLIGEISARLHALARQWRRDRWWFLGEKRVRREWYVDPFRNPFVETVDLRSEVIGNQCLCDGRAPGLSCVVRVCWNRGPQHRPLLLVDFYELIPREPPYPARFLKRLTVEVRFGEERRATGIFTTRAVRRCSLSWRRRLHQIYRRRWALPLEVDPPLRARSTWPAARERLWVDPHSRVSEEVTRFLLLLYLWRRGLIELSSSPDSPEWRSVKTFLRRWRVTGDGEAFLVLDRMRKKYGFPDRSKGTLDYVGKVVRDLRGQRRRPVDQAAAKFGVCRETVYRWIRTGKVQTNLLGGQRVLTKTGEARARKLVDQRQLRKWLMEVLVERGRTPESAQKWVQRRLRKGQTVEQIGRQILWRWRSSSVKWTSFGGS